MYRKCTVQVNNTLLSTGINQSIYNRYRRHNQGWLVLELMEGGCMHAVAVLNNALIINIFKKVHTQTF